MKSLLAIGKQIKVDEDEPVMYWSTLLQRMELLSYISKDNDKVSCDYEGHDVQTSSTVTLSEQGTYTIRVDADAHKGSYLFSWNNVGKILEIL